MRVALKWGLKLGEKWGLGLSKKLGRKEAPVASSGGELRSGEFGKNWQKNQLGLKLAFSEPFFSAATRQLIC